MALAFAGGAIGSVLRWMIGEAFDTQVMLWMANLAGTALLGFINSHPWFNPEERKQFWAVGLCGGFTTMSGLAVWQYSSDFDLLEVGLLVASGLLIYWLFRTITARMLAK
jgi:fluoride ion exporter CrcB/FEX